MIELIGMFFFIKFKFVCDGYDGELFVIIDLWVGLVGLFEFFDFVGCICVLLFVFYFVCLWCLEVYFLWMCNSGIGVFG